MSSTKLERLDVLIDRVMTSLEEQEAETTLAAAKNLKALLEARNLLADGTTPEALPEALKSLSTEELLQVLKPN